MSALTARKLKLIAIVWLAQLAGYVEGADISQAQVWIDRASETFRKSNGSEPADACDMANNWQYDVLHQLSLATELSSNYVLEKLQDQGHAFGMEKTPLYKKWLLAVPGKRTPEDERLVITTSEWWPYKNSTPPYWIAFEANGSIVRRYYTTSEPLGAWRVMGNKFMANLDGGAEVTLRLEHKKYFFDQGQKWYYHLYLVVDAGANAEDLPWYDPLILGPPQGDCGSYNF